MPMIMTVLPVIISNSDGEPKCVSCRVTGKQNGLVCRYGATKHHLPAHLELDHLYMFEASLSLKEGNYHEAEPGFCELVFDFKIDTEVSHIYRCGVQIFPHGHEAIIYMVMYMYFYVIQKL